MKWCVRILNRIGSAHVLGYVIILRKCLKWDLYPNTHNKKTYLMTVTILKINCWMLRFLSKKVLWPIKSVVKYFMFIEQKLSCPKTLLHSQLIICKKSKRRGYGRTNQIIRNSVWNIRLRHTNQSHFGIGNECTVPGPDVWSANCDVRKLENSCWVTASSRVLQLCSTICLLYTSRCV